MDKTLKLLKVGTYKQIFNELLGVSLKIRTIYCSEGLVAHLRSRKHFSALKYIDNIPDIIADPDYIGINPRESVDSIELIKRYEENIIIGIKLDIDRDYYYVSTMYEIQDSKIKRRLHSGRIKTFSKAIDNGENK